MGKLVSISVRSAERQVPADGPADVVIPEYNIIVTGSILGRGVSLWSNVNIYGAQIGENTRIGAFVEIRKGVKIGSNVKIEPFVFIPEGVTVEDGVFIGPGAVFTNDVFPRATGPDGRLTQEYDPVPTLIKRRASIGAGACIRCGVTVGEEAMIGMGAVIVSDVPPKAVVYGEKAAVRRYLP
ncbi:MAG: DapH/DapD/GlmU-related protein [Nitrospinota bacterium]